MRGGHPRVCRESSIPRKLLHIVPEGVFGVTTALPPAYTGRANGLRMSARNCFARGC
jgi:hypothetical protein